MAFTAPTVGLTVGSVLLVLRVVVAVAVALAPDLVIAMCTWSLAYVVWLVGVEDTGKRVGVTVVAGFVALL